MDLKIGDIIAWDYPPSNKMWKFIYKLIEKFDGKIKHVAVYYSEGYIIEAWEGHGVRKRKINLDDKNIRIFRYYKRDQINDYDMKAKLERFWNRTKGDKYSIRDWFNVGISKVTKKLLGKRMYIFPNDKYNYICSEYADTLYKEEFNDKLTGTKTASPNDVVNSKKLIEIEE